MAQARHRARPADLHRRPDRQSGHRPAAIKDSPDVKAGVNVRGTLRTAHAFFSDPSLPQSQIVSLILAGGSLESAQNRTTGNSGAAVRRSRRAPRSSGSSSAHAWHRRRESRVRHHQRDSLVLAATCRRACT